MNDQVIQDLLRAAINISPTDKEQVGFIKMYTEQCLDNVDEKTIIESLLGAMLDGLRHGNWPTNE